MERPDSDRVVNMFFSVQVQDRKHLAHVMRALRRISEVKRVHRART
jgi:(p)ppGpp synthase/HD superfamily hydrolase